MRKIAATYIFPLTQAPIRNGILVIDDDGIVVEIINSGKHFKEEAGLEYYSGILVPGFISVNYNLQNMNKVSIRKMWAQGVAIAVDVDGLKYAVLQKDDCEIQQLTDDDAKKSIVFDRQPNDSPLAELLHFQNKNNSNKLNDVLRWASFDRVQFIGLETQFGSFDTGKKPGVNLLSGVNFQEMKLTTSTRIKRLV